MRSIKIVGISGTGKTTLIRAAKTRFPEAVELSYGDCLRRFGGAAAARWAAALAEERDLYLIDEHLEYGDGDLADVYVRERTAGMLFLEVTPPALVARRAADPARTRDLDPARAAAEQRLAWRRARALSKRLGIPLVRLKDADLGTGLDALTDLIHATG